MNAGLRKTRSRSGASRKRRMTAAVVAEPTTGRLHVVRGNPCCNRPVTYSLTNESMGAKRFLDDLNPE